MVLIFTDRILSMGKVMFSEASVCSWGQGVLPLPRVHHWSHDQGVFLSEGICLGGGGGEGLHQGTGLRKGQPAGRTHPTGMHTCLLGYFADLE